MWPLLLVGGALALLVAFTKKGSAQIASTTAKFSWVAGGNATSLDAGKLYRWSVAARSSRTASDIATSLEPTFTAIQVWTNSFPPDWPAEDRGAGRNRFQGIPKDNVTLAGPGGQPDPTALVWQGFT